MANKLSVAIIFGGRTVEHEVSILTGYQAVEAIDTTKYDVVPIYIARDNVWYIGAELQSLSFFRQDHPPLHKLTRVLPAPNASTNKLELIPVTSSSIFSKPKPVVIDCVIPATHGTFGEDGCLQGILEMADVPYVGSDVRGSAVGMDKLLTKAILIANDLPVLPYLTGLRYDFEADVDKFVSVVEKKFTYPIIVKPAVLGSSVGVTRTDNQSSLIEALDLAFKFGERVLIEPALIDYIEINCSVVDGDPPIASVLEQPFSAKEFLTFDEKYKGNGKKTGGKGMAAQKRLIPAPLDDNLTQVIRDLAIHTYSVIGAGGVARIDFLLSKENKVYINELNNIPGSFSFYLWEHVGKSFKELLDYLIERSFTRHKHRSRFTYSFDSNLLAVR